LSSIRSSDRDDLRRDAATRFKRTPKDLALLKHADDSKPPRPPASPSDAPQWKALARYLSEMADEIVPPDHRVGFAFHAMELFSERKIFQRDKYPKERWQVLDELVPIPEKFDLPIVFGCIRRSEVGEYTLTWTAEGLIRQGTYEGLRADKPAKDVRRPRPA
jgi:hypothetical protein